MHIEIDVQEVWSDDASSHPAIALPWDQWFQRWVSYLQPTLSPIAEYELSLRLTNDAEIQDLNGQYRQMDRPTDVLAFAEIDTEDSLNDPIWLEEPLYLGDLVISVDTASRQALERGHSLKDELAWLAAHGLLHLLGWDHPDEEQLEQMLQKQDELLAQIGLDSMMTS
jgi:probable rRNA maturation factor